MFLPYVDRTWASTRRFRRRRGARWSSPRPARPARRAGGSGRNPHTPPVTIVVRPSAVDGGATTGVRALLRVSHWSRGPLSDSEFAHRRGDDELSVEDPGYAEDLGPYRVPNPPHNPFFPRSFRTCGHHGGYEELRVSTGLMVRTGNAAGRAWWRDAGRGAMWSSAGASSGVAENSGRGAGMGCAWGWWCARGWGPLGVRARSCRGIRLGRLGARRWRCGGRGGRRAAGRR